MVFLGVDIGGTTIKCGFVTEEGKLLQTFVIPTDSHIEMNENIERISNIINQHIKDFPNKDEIIAIGIGCPGSIDSKAGKCDYSGNLNWKQADLSGVFREKTGLPTFVTNDANAHLLGEILFGDKINFDNVIFLTLGTGVGGAMYLDGRLYEGGQSKGGELGHMVINFDGEECGCGRKGCFEAYASATALIRITKEEMKKNRNSYLWEIVEGDINKVEGKTSFIGLSHNDESSKRIVNQYVKYLGTGVLNLINIFRPDAIIIGGGVSNAKDQLINPLKDYLLSEHFGLGGEYCVAPEILLPALGSDAGIYGAAAYAINKMKKCK